jgi:hypothetical protein
MFGSGLLLFCWRADGGGACLRTLALEEIRVDQGYNPSAQRLILFEVLCLEDLEPDLEIRVADENGRILLVAISLALQQPALIRIRVFYIETRIEALDKISRQTIVDPCVIVFAKDDPGLALRIPNDMLPISSGAGDEQRPL